MFKLINTPELHIGNLAQLWCSSSTESICWICCSRKNEITRILTNISLCQLTTKNGKQRTSRACGWRRYWRQKESISSYEQTASILSVAKYRPWHLQRRRQPRVRIALCDTKTDKQTMALRQKQTHKNTRNMHGNNSTFKKLFQKTWHTST